MFSHSAPLLKWYAFLRRGGWSNACFAWTQRMQNPSGEHGEFLPNDEIPETLYPILQRMFTEQFPPLIDTPHKVADWVHQHPDKSTLPRYVGRDEFRLGDAGGAVIGGIRAGWGADPF